ncbi:ribokinase [Lentibacillus kapialis]|uniref:Ribokinase n=1 Tax=Lentibacillus kapialis TaxID=340214 RepID=A0A917UWN4_9BACI|nr:ribokinase [Lentibacillus kapialis]GGJ91051.1 ribokinase [Lentibacillus kapialis]
MNVTVVGSINIDTVAVTDKYPKRGQTIFGNKIEYLPGGKGANQATAVARLGKSANMIGAIGNDIYGDKLVDSLKESNVNTYFIKRSDSLATGTAIITIDQTAENTMLVLKGANEDLNINDVENAFNKIHDSEVLLVQMEVPQDTVIRAMQLAKEKGMYVILDPAPAEGITIKALDYADIVTPNRQETYYMLGIDVVDIDNALMAAETFENMGIKNSIIKMGDKGSVVYQSGEWEYIPSISVEAVDSVGAGDAFAGALACAITNGCDLVSAAHFATAVGALKVTKLGAQMGIPTIDEVNDFCKKKGLTHCYLKESSV